MFSSKSRKAYEKLITGQAVNFQGFSPKETLDILNKAEAECLRCLDKMEKIKELLKQEQALKNTLITIRQTKLQVKAVR